MAKLMIDNALLTSLIGEVAPLVSFVTGWDLHLATLQSRALPKDQGYEEIVLGRLQGLDIQDWKELMPDFFERIIEYMVEQNTLAAYMPGIGEILVIRENVDDSNLDGLKLVLAHELVHRGQHMVHANLLTRVDNLLRQAFLDIKTNTTDLMSMRLYFEQIQPIMTLLESHATYIQGYLKQVYFPEAHIESHFNLGTLLMRLVGAPKVAQYTDGLPQVAEAVKSGRIESLYASLGG